MSPRQLREARVELTQVPWEVVSSVRLSSQHLYLSPSILLTSHDPVDEQPVFCEVPVSNVLSCCLCTLQSAWNWPSLVFQTTFSIFS